MVYLGFLLVLWHFLLAEHELDKSAPFPGWWEVKENCCELGRCCFLQQQLGLWRCCFLQQSGSVPLPCAVPVVAASHAGCGQCPWALGQLQTQQDNCPNKNLSPKSIFAAQVTSQCLSCIWKLVWVFAGPGLWRVESLLCCCHYPWIHSLSAALWELLGCCRAALAALSACCGAVPPSCNFWSEVGNFPLSCSPCCGSSCRQTLSSPLAVVVTH